MCIRDRWKYYSFRENSSNHWFIEWRDWSQKVRGNSPWSRYWSRCRGGYSSLTIRSDWPLETISQVSFHVGMYTNESWCCAWFRWRLSSEPPAPNDTRVHSHWTSVSESYITWSYFTPLQSLHSLYLSSLSLYCTTIFHSSPESLFLFSHWPVFFYRLERNCIFSRCTTLV